MRLPVWAQVAVSDATLYYDKLYTYGVPASIEGHIFVGSIVLAPFGAGRARPRVGVVIALAKEAPQGLAGGPGRVKELLAVAPEEAALGAEGLGIVRYLKEATFCTWYEAVKAVVPYGAQYRAARHRGAWVLQRQMGHGTETVYRLAEKKGAGPAQGEPLAREGEPAGGNGAVSTLAAKEKTEEKITAQAGETPRVGESKKAGRAAKLSEKQHAVLAFLAGGAYTAGQIEKGCGVTRAVAEALVAKGLAQKEERLKEDGLWAAGGAGQSPGPGAAAWKEEDAALAGAGAAGDVGWPMDKTPPPVAAYAADARGAGVNKEIAGNAQGAKQKLRLSQTQAQVTKALKSRMEAEKPEPVLLYGVTGSGKTVVFIELVKAALQKGKTALVLVPEIGLTPQMIARMKAAFGPGVAVQHSGLSLGERLHQWRQIRNGEARVVVGTRSAVFAPLEGIGVIVVDEEQERTYQSESTPRYDAIEVAKRRAAYHGALLVLSSATPAIADYHLAVEGRYELLCLPERYGNLPLPQVDMVDMRNEVMEGNNGAISRALRSAMHQTIGEGGQVILLLNRRGYHRVGVCRACGKALKCGECSVPMVYHRGKGGGIGARSQHGRKETGEKGQELERAGQGQEEQRENQGQGRLLCHYCGRSMAPAPNVCPECGGEIRYMGFGTQKLEEELAEALPKARVLRMDLDSTSKKGAHEKMLAAFAGDEYDILLGTQMVAKGLDFERVRLVGVVGIDSLLFSQGYRAYETVFSLVTQVVGRSGRAGAPGKAMIQTMDPQNPVLALAAKQDYAAFYRQEIAFRKLALYPPYCSVAVVGFVSEKEADALLAARRFGLLLAQQAALQPGVPLRILGPAPMSVAQVAGAYRWRLTLKCREGAAFRALVQKTLASYNKEGWPRKASLYIDMHADGG